MEYMKEKVSLSFDTDVIERGDFITFTTKENRMGPELAYLDTNPINAIVTKVTDNVLEIYGPRELHSTIEPQHIQTGYVKILGILKTAIKEEGTDNGI